jgi:hypothetical protein
MAGQRTDPSQTRNDVAKTPTLAARREFRKATRGQAKRGGIRVDARIGAMTIPLRPQPHNPLHGITLDAMLRALVDHYGWSGLAERVPVRCFAHEPSISSSLRLLRRTPWARDKVESLYLFMVRPSRRTNGHAPGAGPGTPRP